MGQDIRKLLKEEKMKKTPLPKGHSSRFEKKLDAAFPKEKEFKFFWLKIAAVLVVILGITAFFYFQKPSEAVQLVETATQKEENVNTSEENFGLRDLSPQYKKVEDFYMASINMEIAKLNITKENKALIDAFLEQLSFLDKEYALLNKELSLSGVNEQTVQALLDNLKLRLDLLLELKMKLKELKQQENEKFKTNKG